MNLKHLKVNDLQFKKLLKKKYIICILFYLANKKEISYGEIKDTLQIPNATLAIRLGELVSCNLLEKFTYGETNRPHNTGYLLPTPRLDYINTVFSTDTLWN